MAVQLPPQPWDEGMSFTVDETGLEYVYNGEVWVSEGKPVEFPDAAAPVHVGQTPPDDPSEGDLWMLDTDDEDRADRLFVRVGDAWEPTTSLQHERQMRIVQDLIVAEQMSRADSHYMYQIGRASCRER